MATFPEPQAGAHDTAQSFLRYLDYFRAVTVEKLEALTDEQLRSSVLPSGWTPLELIKHLVFMERRWFRWGFLAEQVDLPWGDQGPDGRWHVDPDETLEQLADQLLAGGEQTRDLFAAASLDTPAKIGGRFDDTPPHLEAICFHVFQEYARHLGHLDVVRELIDGQTGE